MTKEPKIKRNVIRSGVRLLDMEYSIPELANELNIPEPYIRRTLVSGLGCPHRKDDTGHIWINGAELYKWALEISQKREEKKEKLADDEFYCLRCSSKVRPQGFTIEIKRNRHYKSAVCPTCGGRLLKVYKIIREV